MAQTAVDAPLTNYRVIGVQENRIIIAGGTPDAHSVPGGSCWHCGTGIAIEVVIKSTTGETHTIGTTCAERVGLNGPELKAMLAERYAEERYLRSAAVVKAQREAAAKVEAEETAKYGEHGTESRYASGCSCQPCRNAAPHGTVDRYYERSCTCLRCLDALVSSRPGDFKVQPDRHVIVSLTTGEVVQAKTVDTKFGYRWCVRDGASWLPVSPARRSTHAKHGYVQAEAPYLVEKCGQGSKSFLKPIARIGEPLVDMWGERIERACA
jgi:hypothetical protein